MDEIPRYKKKKSQASKSAKRADHKHEYVKSITMCRNLYDQTRISWYWTTNCLVCGRQGDFIVNNDDFRKPEYIGRRLFHTDGMFLSPCEILRKFREFPVYLQDADDPFRYRKMTDEEREQYLKMGE